MSAQLRRALTHPNICTIYEVDTRPFIAMEYVDGRPLSDRITESAVPLQEAVRYGIETADALAYAHDQGVIHRDLKAANAMLTTTGRLKLVDFGLARRESASLVEATTMMSLAPAGIAVGTPYAMAPEQVRGGVTDARTDIWALGVLLYELASGAKPFAAPTAPELFSLILRDAPAPMSYETPRALQSIIEQCLRKEPERRYQSAHDVRAALEGIQSGTRPAPAILDGTNDVERELHAGEAAPATSWLRLIAVSLFAVTLAAGFFAWQARRAARIAEPLRAVTVTTAPGIERNPSFSPDGNDVAFMWTGPRQDNADIYVQMLGEGSPVGEPTRHS